MRAFAILALTVFALGCDDAMEPEPSGVAGAYEAVEFTTTTDGSVIDHLAGGAQFEITLAADGTTTGTLLIPGADDGGGDLVADLAGSWTRNGDTVTFDHSADTFIRDMPFEYQNGRLVGEVTFGDSRIRVVLAGND